MDGVRDELAITQVSGKRPKEESTRGLCGCHIWNAAF